MPRRIAVLLFLALLLGSACQVAEQPRGKPSLFVSIGPHAYFAKQIADTLVNIEVLLRPGDSPATFEPTPRQMTQLSEADLYLRAGVPFENRLVDKIGAQNPGLKIVDAREGISTLVAEHHSHGSPDHQVAEETDPHIWLDPRLARVQAKTICDALVELVPEAEEELQQNLAALDAQLLELDSLLATQLEPLTGRSFWVFHPAYGYFGKRYGMRQVAIEDEGKEPSVRQLAQLLERAGTERILALFVQPQFSTKGAELIATQVGCRVVVVDPLDEDYFSNLRRLADELTAMLAAP